MMLDTYKENMLMTSEQASPIPSPFSILHGEGAGGGRGYYKLIKRIPSRNQRFRPSLKGWGDIQYNI